MKATVRSIACCAVLYYSVDSAVAQQVAPDPAPPVSTESASSAPPSLESSPPKDKILVVAKPERDERNRDWLQKYLPYEQRVAGWVDNTARSIDRFFGTDDAWRVDNESWLRVTNDLRWEQDEGVGNDLRPRLKLDLPTATERLHLLVESDDVEERTAAEEAVPGLRRGDQQRRTTVLGLGLNFDSWLPEWKKQLQGGLRVALPLDPYARFIMRRDIPLGGEWELNSYNRLSWFNSDGYGANSEIKFGKPIAPDWRLYYNTDFSWREKRDHLKFAQTANLAQVLDASSAITYTLGFLGTGFESPEITKYFLTADYRRNIARRIVFVDVIPELSLPDEYGFDPHWAITLRLELYFQKRIDD